MLSPTYSGMTGVDFVVVNTDAQDLARSMAPRRYNQSQSTKGLGLCEAGRWSEAKPKIANAY